jgi:hypothetical protein
LDVRFDGDGVRPNNGIAERKNNIIIVIKKAAPSGLGLGKNGVSDSGRVPLP